MEKADRINSFYELEKWALSPKTQDRAFLVVPKDPTEPGQTTEWTYAQAYEIVLKYARWLKEELGVKKNEIVALDYTNRPQFVWLWFALWSLGAKPAFINSNLRSNAFVHCVRVSTARLLLLDPMIREAYDEQAQAELGSQDGRGRGIDTVILEEDVQRAILTGEPLRVPDSERSGDKAKDTGMLIYTSGTTGLPKAANVP